MASRTRRKNTITKFIGDLVDDTKDFVDDLIDRARDVEDDLRTTARNLVDDEDEASEDEVASLKKGLADLTAKVDKLVGAGK